MLILCCTKSFVYGTAQSRRFCALNASGHLVGLVVRTGLAHQPDGLRELYTPLYRWRDLCRIGIIVRSPIDKSLGCETPTDVQRSCPNGPELTPACLMI